MQSHSCCIQLEHLACGSLGSGMHRALHARQESLYLSVQCPYKPMEKLTALDKFLFNLRHFRRVALISLDALPPSVSQCGSKETSLVSALLAAVFRPLYRSI
jgi:hypothetical protein